MLPAYIIHDILERERAIRGEHREELVIEIPQPGEVSPDKPDDRLREPNERGIVVLDFTI